MSASPITTDARHELREQARKHVVAALAETKTGGFARLDTDALDDVADSIGHDDANDLYSDVLNALHNLISTRDELSRKMNDAKNGFEDTERFIRGEASRFNSLGVLQGAGSDIDRLCGLFHVQVDYAVAAQFRLLLAVAKAQA